MSHKEKMIEESVVGVDVLNQLRKAKERIEATQEVRGAVRVAKAITQGKKL